MSLSTSAEIEVFVKKWLHNAADCMRGLSARMHRMLLRKADQLRCKSKKYDLRAASDQSDLDNSSENNVKSSNSSVDDAGDVVEAL